MPSKILGREPVLWLAALNAVVALAVGFGLDLDGTQQALIHAAASALLGLVARGQVVPVVTHDEQLDHLNAIYGAMPDPDDLPTTGSPEDGQSVLLVALVALVVCVILLLAFDLIHIG